MAFWSKDAQVRVDETIEFILSKLPPQERGAAKTFLQQLTGLAGPETSKAMSTSGVSNAGDKDTRAMRRALVLIAGDMLGQTNPNRKSATQTMAMSPAEVATNFNKLLLPFRIYVSQEAGRNELLSNVLLDIKRMPEAFLRNNTVVTASAPFPNGGGVGGVVMHSFWFNYKSGQYRIAPASLPRMGAVDRGGVTFQAINVPELLWFDVPERGNQPSSGSFAKIPATELVGSDMMITSAFTGCSFCFKISGYSAYAAHIGPSGVISGKGPSIGPPPTLAEQLGGAQGTGDFASPPGAKAGALKVYGLGYSNLPNMAGGYSVEVGPKSTSAENMTIIGVKNGDFWKMVSQDTSFGDRKVAILT